VADYFVAMNLSNGLIVVVLHIENANQMYFNLCSYCIRKSCIEEKNIMDMQTRRGHDVQGSAHAHCNWITLCIILEQLHYVSRRFALFTMAA